MKNYDGEIPLLNDLLQLLKKSQNWIYETSDITRIARLLVC